MKESYSHINKQNDFLVQMMLSQSSSNQLISYERHTFSHKYHSKIRDWETTEAATEHIQQTQRSSSLSHDFKRVRISEAAHLKRYLTLKTAAIIALSSRTIWLH
jgi:hypothetical protein